MTDFEAFGLNHRLTMPRKKLERLKDQPEDSWDLMWNTTLIYSLFPNTILVVQGEEVAPAGAREQRRPALAFDRQPHGEDEQAQPNEANRLQQIDQLVQHPFAH